MFGSSSSTWPVEISTISLASWNGSRGLFGHVAMPHFNSRARRPLYLLHFKLRHYPEDGTYRQNRISGGKTGVYWTLLEFLGLFLGGERGIRTLDRILSYTPLAGARLRPLGHLSIIRSNNFNYIRLFIYLHRVVEGALRIILRWLRRDHSAIYPTSTTSIWEARISHSGRQADLGGFPAFPRYAAIKPPDRGRTPCATRAPPAPCISRRLRRKS